jgi:hypothetical protein
MVYGVFPNPLEPHISWESHALGAVCGLLLAVYFRKVKVIDDHGEQKQAEDESDKGDHHDPDDATFFSDPSSTDAGNYTYKFKGPDG